MEYVKAVFNYAITEIILFQISLILISSFLAATIWKKFVNRASRLALKSKLIWDDLFVNSISKPVHFALPVIGILLSIEIYSKRYQEIGDFNFSKTTSVLLVFVLSWSLLRAINELREKLNETYQVNPTNLNLISNFGYFIVTFTAILLALHNLGVNITSLLTLGSIGGIAIGLATKDILANFFGGLVVYFDRAFEVGDWIKSPDKNIEGTVEKIGIRGTIVRNFEQRPMYIPNSLFSSIIVENPSRMSNRRIYEKVGIRYQDASKLDSIIKKVESMLRNHNEIDSSQTLMVNFDKFASSSLEFFIYCFTKTKNWKDFHQVKQDILLKVISIIHEEKADFAFPTSSVFLEKTPKIKND